MNKEKTILDTMMNKEYYDLRELKYAKSASLFLSSFEINSLLDYKSSLLDDKSTFEKLDLVAYDNHPLFFAKCVSLIIAKQEYDLALKTDYEDFKEPFSWRHASEVVKSRIYSEIEGSLAVESVPTTRKRIAEIINGKQKLETKNDQIILNMANGIDFVNEKPEFNETNLFKLYQILSHDCLDEKDILHPGDCYRYDQVEVDQYQGCPVTKIKECLDSLFSFVNAHLKDANYADTLPHICHYYLLYIHPYFDYNGRTSRMVSLWVNLLQGNKFTPQIASEAIDQTKKQYYLSLENSRDCRNDITYFLLYMFTISTEFIYCYENIDYITDDLLQKGISFSETDRTYLKKILISSKGNFTYEDFESFTKTEMSKQGALKILNKFVSYGILNIEESKSKRKLFSVNKGYLKYSQLNISLKD